MFQIARLKVRMAVKTNIISYPFANIKMENSLYKTSLGGAVQSFEQYSPLTVVDKNGVSSLIPSTDTQSLLESSSSSGSQEEVERVGLGPSNASLR